MKLSAPSVCPVCGGQYEITELTCKKCESQLKGHFQGCEFCDLSDEDLSFIMTFLKCRGSIKDVERELGISYPTVRGRLDKVIKRLGLATSESDAEIKETRTLILDRLNEGEITADQAAELLSSL